VRAVEQLDNDIPGKLDERERDAGMSPTPNRGFRADRGWNRLEGS
jgi:hypothetical protein